MMATKRQVGDLVLIYYQDKPAVYGRIEAIEPDVKKDWYQVRLLLLTIPAQAVTWILRAAYVDGEPFTMGGRPVRLEAVVFTPAPSTAEEPQPAKSPNGLSPSNRVIPFKKPS